MHRGGEFDPGTLQERSNTVSQASRVSPPRNGTRTNEVDPSWGRNDGPGRVRGPPLSVAGRTLPSLLVERLDRLAGRKGGQDGSPDDPQPSCRDNVGIGDAYPAASLGDFLERRSNHWASLGRLDTEIAAAEERRSDAEVSALRRRLAEWVRNENTLDAVGAGLIFRLYWDDLGGES